MCIVPVKVYDSDKGREMMTYAMLDNCSQGSFISESLVKQMNLSGRKTTLNLKTLKSKKLETAIVIDGLKVSSANGKEDWIKLPKLYTRMQIPVERGEIATPGKIGKWDYLKVISEEIIQSDDVEVELLIGAKCPKALDNWCQLPEGSRAIEGDIKCWKWTICILSKIRVVHCGSYRKHD